MKVALETLLSSVGRAVQESQTYLERQAIASYRGYFRPLEQQDSAELLAPAVEHFQLPDGKGGHRLIEVPQAALAHHNSLALDTVCLRLHVTPQVEEAGVMVEVGPADEADGGSVLELTFRTCPMAEGAARVNQQMTSIL